LIARDLKEEVRVCDYCDTEMDNFELKKIHEDEVVRKSEQLALLDRKMEDIYTER
jgi:hypothetical protein